MVSIKVEGLEEAIQRLRSIPPELSSQARDIMHRAVVTFTEDARSRIYSPMGRARAGIIGKETAALQGSIKARSKAAKHSIRGRRPGKAPKVGTVKRFMARAGRPVSRAEAFLIARSIGASGMQGHPVMEATFASKAQRVVSMFFEAMRRVVEGHGS